MSKPDKTVKNPKVKIRLVWRLVLSLCLHLTLLLMLAIYLVMSLNSVQRYAPVANATEIELESLSTIPTLLGAMDVAQRAYQKNGDPRDLALYTQTRRKVQTNLDSLNTPLLVASDNEIERRNLVQKWISKIGDFAIHQPGIKPSELDLLNVQSGVLLQRLDDVTQQVRHEAEATLVSLQEQEAREASSRVTLMWIGVGTVFVFTIIFQWLVSNSIITPIQSLDGVVRRLQNGDYTVRAHIHTGDEIQSLGETFNAMAANILRKQQELEEKNERLFAQQEALRDVNTRLEERVAEKTEQIRQTLASVEAERAKLRTLFERMPDGLLLLDESGAIGLINDAALTILGHRDIVSLQSWITDQPGAFSFRHLDHQAIADRDIPYRRVLRGETFSNISLYLRGWDNQTRLVSFSGAPVPTLLQNKAALSLLIFRDVTRELALRQELEDKNQKLNEGARLKDEFLATFSHEFRTPLTPVISCAHLLGADPALGPEQLKNVQVIDRNARALSRMIDELLDLSAVMNRKLRLSRERTEMNEWTIATLQTMSSAWEKKELDVTFIRSENLIELDIDPTRLAQVLTNVVNNAIKFTDPKGTIIVCLVSLETEVRISVNDTGAGLTKHEIDQIFQMFHQSRTRRTQGVGGLGVGLTVARSLTELHGGGLLAESPGPGLGSTFTICLPHLSDSAAVDFSQPSLAPPPQLTAADRTLLRGRRILLVEDSTDTREALERIFQRRQCQITTATSAEEVLEQIRREPPEIILSDIGLPGLSGLDLMTKLRARAEWRDVIAIALSGLGREKDIAAAAQAGFDAHLLKPIDIAILDETLVQALQKKLHG